MGAFTTWVYGYYATWKGTLEEVPWDRLTHVAIFDVELTASGGLTRTSNWTDNVATALALAEPYGVKVHLAVADERNEVGNQTEGRVAGGARRRSRGETGSQSTATGSETDSSGSSARRGPVIRAAVTPVQATRPARRHPQISRVHFTGPGFRSEGG